MNIRLEAEMVFRLHGLESKENSHNPGFDFGLELCMAQECNSSVNRGGITIS